MILSATLSIRHTPRGVEHPYEPSPIERLPRDPVAGQETILRIESTPPGEAQSLAAVWQVNGGPEHTTIALHECDTESTSQWRAYPAAQAARFEWYEDPSRPPVCFDICPYDESLSTKH